MFATLSTLFATIVISCLYRFCTFVSMFNQIHTVMRPTHILFSEDVLYPTIEPITEEWHLTCNNFKGSLEECQAEALRLKKAYKPQCWGISEPHYPNAPEGSIWDY